MNKPIMAGIKIINFAQKNIYASIRTKFKHAYLLVRVYFNPAQRSLALSALPKNFIAVDLMNDIQ